MRAWDRIETEASGHTPAQGLELGLAGSTWCVTAVINSEPEAMLGVAPMDMATGEGRPWFLGTDVVAREHRAWLLHSRDVVSRMLAEYRMLTNYVACGNMLARAWLCRTGFAFDAEPAIVGGVEMLRFWKHR